MADPGKPTGDRRATEYLANERTFLAWIRTSIAIISLGFVVAKFSVWLNELAAKLQPGVAFHRSGASMPLGVSIMALGGLLALLAAWRYDVVNRAIASGVVRPDRSNGDDDVCGDDRLHAAHGAAGMNDALSNMEIAR